MIDKATIAQLRRFGGWQGSLLLVVIYVFLEVGTSLLGGDWGAFLYVTFHFIVMPLLALGVILVTLILALVQQGTLWARVVIFGSVIVPAAIIGLAFSGEPGLARLLPPF